MTQYKSKKLLTGVDDITKLGGIDMIMYSFLAELKPFLEEVSTTYKISIDDLCNDIDRMKNKKAGTYAYKIINGKTCKHAKCKTLKIHKDGLCKKHYDTLDKSNKGPELTMYKGGGNLTKLQIWDANPKYMIATFSNLIIKVKDEKDEDGNDIKVNYVGGKAHNKQICALNTSDRNKCKMMKFKIDSDEDAKICVNDDGKEKVKEDKCDTKLAALDAIFGADEDEED